jgi:phosphinothricin acetyltransferase
MALAIRAAQISDATAIARIYEPYVRETAISFEDHPPTATEMAERVASTATAYPYLVAERDGAVVGYAYAGAVRSRAAYRASTEVTVYVHCDEHGRGVGRALYLRLLEELRERGFHTAFACIALPNAPSVALHEAVGFRPVGIWREAGMKFDRWHDVGWWQVMLSDGPPPS